MEMFAGLDNGGSGPNPPPLGSGPQQAKLEMKVDGCVVVHSKEFKLVAGGAEGLRER